jgi:2'-5' RNA ligase
MTFLNRLYATLKERLAGGGFLSSDEFADVFKQARGHAGGKARAEMHQLAAEGNPTGCIVCLVPDAETAQALAVEGGLAPELLHLTLCHFGEVDMLGPVERAETLLAVRDAAACCAPLTGEISGIGRFTNGEQDVIYASLDSPALNELREHICDALEAAGFACDDEHGFTPHFTLTYVNRDMPSPIEIVEPRPVRFEALGVWYGLEHVSVPLLGMNAASDDAADLATALGVNPDGTLIPAGDRSEPDVEGTPYEYLAGEVGDLADLAAAGHTHRLFNSIAFAEAPAWIPYLPKPGSYAHPRYGTITITKERNQRFVSNFDAKVYQDRLPVDAEHETKLSGAVGWIMGMRLNADGSADAKVDWTDRGQAFFAADRFRYFSPEWYDAWEDPATRMTYQDVAIGGALTTRPFFKDPALRPLFASEGSLTVDDNPEGDTMAEQNTQSFAELQQQLDALKTENATLKQAGETAAEQAKLTSERLAAVERERQTERFTALIRNDGARWFGETSELMTELEQFAKTFGEGSAEFAAYVKRQKATAEMLRQSAAFNELGGDGGGRQEDPSAKLDRLAKERASKDNISYSDAMSKVAAEQPDLYAQHSSAAYVRTKGAE